jgi:hypothetical protein
MRCDTRWSQPLRRDPIAIWSTSAVCAVALAACVAALPAHAELRAFEGRFSVVLPTFGEQEIATGVGVANVNAGSPGAELWTLSLDGDIQGTAALPVTDPTAAPMTSIEASVDFASGDLRIDASGGTFGTPVLADGELAIPGQVRMWFLVGGPHGGMFPLDLTTVTYSGATNGLGVGGIATAGGIGAIRMSLYGAPFTVNTATVMVLTDGGAPVTLLSSGSLHGPYSFPSTAALSGGRLSVVTPIRVTSLDTPEGGNDFPGFLRVEIRLLPEPGVLLLLVAGGSGLLLMGRTRRGTRRNGGSIDSP